MLRDSCYEVFRIESGPGAQNCYVVRSRASCLAVLIDPGSAVDEIWTTVQREKVTVAAILLTHAHYDHMDGVSPLRERVRAPLYVHESDVALLASANAFAMVLKLPRIKIPNADYRLLGGEKLVFGDMVVDVLHLPGHTKGGVSYSMGRFLFVGDTLLPSAAGRTDLPGGDEKALDLSIRKILSCMTEQTTLCPGHGDPTDLCWLRNHNERVRRCLEKPLNSGLSAGWSPPSGCGK